MLPRPSLSGFVICTQPSTLLPGGDVVVVPDGGGLDTHPIVGLAGGGGTKEGEKDGEEDKNVSINFHFSKTI